MNGLNYGYIPERDLNFSLSRTVAPALDVVTLAEARLQLRVDTIGSPATNPEDSLISRLVNSATAQLDAGTGWLARALAPQTWRLGLDKFPSAQYTWGISVDDRAIFLPYPPFIKVVSFTYVNSEGTTVTMVEGTDYRVVSYDGDAPAPAKLLPVYGGDWPNARHDVDSIQITFRCGYTDGNSPETHTVPDLIKDVILFLVTDMYDSRGVVTQGIMSKVPQHILQALQPYRIRRVFP